MIEEFEVGDEVCVSSGHGLPTRKLTVTKKLKRYLECSDGSKWLYNGMRYGGSGDPWDVSSLSRWGPENERARFLQRVDYVWSKTKSNLSLDQLKRIAGILKEGS